jgi:hypothetical protein
VHSITDWRRIWDLHFCLIFSFSSTHSLFYYIHLESCMKKTDWLWLPRLFEHRGKRVGGGKLGRLLIWLTSMRENRGKRSHWDLYLGSCPFPFSSFYFFSSESVFDFICEAAHICGLSVRLFGVFSFSFSVLFVFCVSLTPSINNLYTLFLCLFVLLFSMGSINSFTLLLCFVSFLHFVLVTTFFLNLW